jgi:hypothetical protein
MPHVCPLGTRRLREEILNVPDRQGQFFTDRYCERPDPTEDSAVFRRRLGAYLQHTLHAEHWELHQYLKREAGFTLDMTSTNAGLYHHYEKLVAELPTTSLLNGITHVWRFLWDKHKTFVKPNPAADKLMTELLKQQDVSKPVRTVPPTGEWRSQQAESWRQFVERAMREENVAYRIDDRGGLHPAVDVEFEHSKESLIRGLSDPRYAAVRAALEEAHRALGVEQRNTKSAVRAMFEAVEILTKLIAPSATRLNDATVKRDLGDLVRTAYAADSVACSAAILMMEGLAKWVNSLHIYRHGQGTEEPIAPPIGFAIHVVSSGSAWLRLLLDTQNKQS